MPQRILYVFNHKAGANNRIDIQDCFKKHSEKKHDISSFYQLGEDPFREIEKRVDTFKPDVIVAAGGDGTLHMIANIIKNRDISLLMIPAGSANGMAKEFDMPEDPETCLKLLEEGKTVSIDLLKINDVVSIHLADVGLNARIVRRFQMDRKRGMLTYAKYLFNEVFVIKIRRFFIEIDGKSRRVKAVSLTFANATKYGTGAVINPEGVLNDGLFEICIVKPFPRIHLASIALKMFRNRLKYSEFFETIHCREAVVRSRRKTLLQVDGEIAGRVREIHMKVMPAALKVIIPNHLNYPTLID